MREREFEVFGDQLFDVWAPDLLGILQLHHLKNVDRPKPSTVSSCHVLVKGLNGIGS